MAWGLQGLQAIDTETLQFRKRHVVPMKPKPQPRDAFELFQAHFDQMLDPNHELVQMANQIDWPGLDFAFADRYRPDIGAPAKAIRLMVCLHYLVATTNRSNWIVASIWRPMAVLSTGVLVENRTFSQVYLPCTKMWCTLGMPDSRRKSAPRREFGRLPSDPSLLGAAFSPASTDCHPYTTPRTRYSACRPGP